MRHPQKALFGLEGPKACACPKDCASCTLAGTVLERALAQSGLALHTQLFQITFQYRVFPTAVKRQTRRGDATLAYGHTQWRGKLVQKRVSCRICWALLRVCHAGHQLSTQVLCCSYSRAGAQRQQCRISVQLLDCSAAVSLSLSRCGFSATTSAVARSSAIAR